MEIALFMAFKELFIDIDQYASDDINELSCARRDAIALHALFMDTFGGTGELLTDAEAGHGTTTYELVAHDT